MYERFTDRSRKVLQLANQQAIAWNHEYIGTEHILFGLCKEGSGVASNVLKNLDIDLRKITLEVEKLVQAGPKDLVPMGKLPQTPRAKKVIESAIEAAKELNHNYIGTEHLLLGLCRLQEGTAYEVLKACGVTTEQVKEEILELVGPKKEEEKPKDEKAEQHWKGMGWTLPPTPTLLATSWSIDQTGTEVEVRYKFATADKIRKEERARLVKLLGKEVEMYVLHENGTAAEVVRHMIKKIEESNG